MSNNNSRGRSLSFFLVAALSVALWPAAETSVMAQRRSAARRVAAITYECPMHPEVTSKRRGKCPKCGMTLVAKSKTTPRVVTSDADTATAATATTTKPAEDNQTSIRIPTDVMVQDQTGRKLNFYTDLVKGKTVIINFIFTTCTTICPPLTATFRKVQQELGERAGRDVHLISISVDPTIDVPERLRDYAAQFKAGPGWTFVTGSRSDIDSLLKAFGVAVADKNDHTPMILVGNDAANYWTRAFGLAPASTLIKIVNEAAARSSDKGASANGSATSQVLTTPLISH
jgi:cytochrome oxidase Cu insertion factor (SCO1/SenC/PrrC family)